MSIKDKRHPQLSNVSGEDGIQAIIAIHRKWLALQPEGTGDLYCEHGCYVDRNHVLAYLCPRCNADGSLSFPSRRARLNP